MGRLFFTPAQRSSLDVARSQRARTTLATERPEEQPAPQEQTITYGGMVRRSDGKSTAWINGRPVREQETIGGTTIVGRIGPDGRVSLQNAQSGRSVALKPGQSLELLSGTIEEGYTRKPVNPESKPAAKPPVEAKSVANPAAPAAGEKEDEEKLRARLEDAIAQAMRDAAAAAAKSAEAPTSKPDQQPR